VVLFIACGAFVGAAIRTANTLNPGINATAQVTLISGDENIPFEKILQINEKFNEYEGAVASFAAQQNSWSVDEDSYMQYRTTVPGDMMTNDYRELRLQYSQNQVEKTQESPVNFVASDPVNYLALCAAAGVPKGGNILLNFNRGYDVAATNHRYDYVPFKFANQTLEVRVSDSETVSVPLAGAVTDYPPFFTSTGATTTVNILLPSIEPSIVYWYVDVPDSAGFTEYANSVLREVLNIPTLGEAYEMQGYNGAGFSVDDIAEHRAAQIRQAKMMSVLIYSFVALLTLIGLPNIISTVSANTRLRYREFAVLQSVGMTRGGLNRMLNLECLLLGAKSLVAGIPLGLIAAVILHKALVQTALTDFYFPWLSILECAVGVFTVTLITIRASSAKRRGTALVDAIRAHEGM
jgi:putative ABC transport system permease protein